MRTDIQRAVQAGTTAWWLNAVLAHTQSLDDGLDHLKGHVLGLTTPCDPQAWSIAVGALRARSIYAVSLAIVEPGDPVGLPGPAEVTQSAVRAGVALVAMPSSLTLIPDSITDNWRAFPSMTASASIQPGTLSESRRSLREAMGELTLAFPALDPDSAAVAGLAEYRQFVGPLPPAGISARAREVATDALRVWWLSGLAIDLCQRRGIPVPTTLRHLRPTARRAASVAFSERPLAPGHDEFF